VAVLTACSGQALAVDPEDHRDRLLDFAHRLGSDLAERTQQA
jgi:hypothetical protein